MGPGGLVQPGGPVSQVGWSAGGGQPTGTVTPQTSSTRPQTTTGGRTTVVTSSNCAGYAATGGSGAFTSHTSSWVQPAGKCYSGNQYAAFWDGLDRYTSSTVGQTGSEVHRACRTPHRYT